MNERRAIVVFVEGCFEDVHLRATLAEARAFSEGVSVGAGCYGAGSCQAYVLPEDSAEMDDDAASDYSDLTATEVIRARGAAAEAMENARLAEECD